jgi:hypothetical protein
MQGKKTHEQQLRTLERKPDYPDSGRTDAADKDQQRHQPDTQARESEFPVSRGGLHQESDHNKHNRSGQSSHKPQSHEPAQEKHYPEQSRP